MSRIRRQTRDELSPDQEALYDVITGGRRAEGPRLFEVSAPDGSLNGPFGALLIEPGLGSAISAVGEAIRFRSALSDQVREVAILVVAASRASEFEWYAHERVGRHVGLGQDVLDALGRRVRPELQDRASAVAWEVVDELTRQRRLSDRTYARAASELGERGVFELAALTGYYELLATVMEAFDVSGPTGHDPVFP